MYYKAINRNSADNLILNGWMYKQVGNGPITPISSLEALAVSGSGVYVASFDGQDLREMSRIYGITEFEALPVIHNSLGQRIVGPGRLTGRVFYADGKKPVYPGGLGTTGGTTTVNITPAQETSIVSKILAGITAKFPKIPTKATSTTTTTLS